MSIGSKKAYQPRDDGDIKALVDACPLAWIICGGAADFAATPIPVQLRCDEEGRPSMLVGHFARSNPQVAQLAEQPDAWVLLMGPQAYVSSSWFDDRSQTPTWNYASVAFHVTVVLEENPDTIRKRLEDLVAAMESSQSRAWQISDMGERYAKLSPHIIGFHAPIHEVRASFKLGQDERGDVFADALAGLQASGKHDMVAWMERVAGPERMAATKAARDASQAPARASGSPSDDDGAPADSEMD